MNCRHLMMLSIILGVGISTGLAQSIRSMVAEGNEFYADKKFSDAEVEYRKALEKDGHLVEGLFNLGNALYKQGKVDEAMKQFDISAVKTDGSVQANALYNLGNAYLKAERYEDAVKAYAKSLGIQPHDMDAKYNLSYALEKLKQQQQPQSQKKEEDQEKEKEDQQQQDKKSGENQEKKEDSQQRQDPKQEQQQQDQQRSQPEKQMSRADAERILEVLKNNEKDVQKKLQTRKAVRAKTDRDW